MLRIAGDAGDGTLEPVGEQHAVGQAGQAVVKRIAQQLLLGFLAGGDVGLRAGHAGGFPGRRRGSPRRGESIQR